MTFDTYTEIIDAINRIDVDGPSSLNIVLDLYNVKLSDVEDMIAKNYQSKALNFVPAMKFIVDSCADKLTQQFNIKKFLAIRDAIKKTENQHVPYLPYKICISIDPSSLEKSLEIYGPKDFKFFLDIGLWTDLESLTCGSLKNEIQELWHYQSKSPRIKYYGTL